MDVCVSHPKTQFSIVGIHFTQPERGGSKCVNITDRIQYVFVRGGGKITADRRRRLPRTFHSTKNPLKTVFNNETGTELNPLIEFKHNRN